MSNIVYLDGLDTSSDDIHYVAIELRADGGAWIEVMAAGKSLGVEIGPDQIDRLRRLLERSA